MTNQTLRTIFLGLLALTAVACGDAGMAPPDGLTMLVDQLLPGGLTIVEPGVDHYFDHPDRELRSLALLEVLLNRLAATSSVAPGTQPLVEGAAHASLGPE